MKRIILKSINDILTHKTTSKTFRAYFREMRRHEEALKRIYAKDKLHTHVPEEVGRVSKVWPEKRLMVVYYRCAVCMKDLTEPEAKKLLDASTRVPRK